MGSLTRLEKERMELFNNVIHEARTFSHSVIINGYREKLIYTIELERILGNLRGAIINLCNNYDADEGNVAKQSRFFINLKG